MCLFESSGPHELLASKLSLLIEPTGLVYTSPYALGIQTHRRRLALFNSLVIVHFPLGIDFEDKLGKRGGTGGVRVPSGRTAKTRWNCVLEVTNAFEEPRCRSAMGFSFALPLTMYTMEKCE